MRKLTGDVRYTEHFRLIFVSGQAKNKTLVFIKSNLGRR